MSRGHGRVQRIILDSVNNTRYGCTVRQLAYRTYGVRGEGGPTDTQLDAVRRAVSRLLAEGRVIERAVLGHDRYILPAAPPAPRAKLRRSSTGTVLIRQTLQCRDCDLRWVSEDGAPHRSCWSCGRPGQATRSVVR